MPLLTLIATMTEKYGNGEWVRDSSVDESNGSGGDGQQQRRWKKFFVPCAPNDPGARKRWKSRWIPVTPGYILVWLSVLMARGADGRRQPEMYWSTRYGEGVAWIRNSLTRDAFVQIRRSLHFVDNSTLPKKGDPRWSPLQKIEPVLKLVQCQLGKAWILGQRCCVDESMIKYMGRAISWVQYMPAKPIKHGIKVFALCCAKTGFLLAFEVFTGKGNGLDGTPLNVIKRLVLMAGIASYVSGTWAESCTPTTFTRHWR